MCGVVVYMPMRDGLRVVVCGCVFVIVIFRDLLSYSEQTVDALASGAEEGRSNLR